MLFFWALLASHLPFARTALNREPLITPAALLPRQASSCAATATACPDGLGCCPRGYPCSYSSNIPVCNKACNARSVYCSQGGCCDPGSTCIDTESGLCSSALGGAITSSSIIPSLTTPVLTTTPPSSTASTSATSPQLPIASTPTTSLTPQPSKAGAAPFNQPWGLGIFDVAIVGIIGFLGL